MILGFSLGCMHRFVDSVLPDSADKRNKDCWLTWLRTNRYHIGRFNGIEIIMPAIDEKKFILSKENHAWLSDMTHISYHLTHCNTDTMNAISQLPFISTIICHVDNKKVLTDYFIKKYEKKILFENIEHRSSNFLLSDKICFDYAHACSISKEYLLTFWMAYQKQIKLMHLSRFDNKEKHSPLFLNKEKYVTDKFNHLKDIPVILEASCKNIGEMKQELEFVRGKLYDK